MMEPYGNFFMISKEDVGTEVVYKALLFVEDASQASGYRQEEQDVQATIISYRTSKADPTVVMPVLAYVSPVTGTIHVIEPFAFASPMGAMIRLNRVTLSNNAVKKICKVAGLTVQ